MKSGKTSIAEIKSDGDIFIVRFKDNADLDGEGIIELLAKLEELSGGKNYKALADTNDMVLGHISRSAYNENIKKENAPHRMAEAFVVTGLPIRLLINFYHKSIRPEIPSKAFKTIKEAKEWLSQF